MGKKWPHEAVSEAGALMPEGMLTVKVVSGAEDETRNGKYCIVFKTRVVEPKSVRNQPYRIGFVVGTDDDPEADEKSTWTSSFAASRYKSFLKAADVPETGDIDEEIDSAKGATLRVENGHSEDGKYNDPRAFYRVSDEAAESEEEEEEEEEPVKPAKSAKKPSRKSKPEPEDEDEDEDDEDFE